MSWKRLSSVTIPTVWRRFEGKKFIQNGKKREYWVQDVTDQHKEIVVKHMVFGFGREEPMSLYNNVLSYPEATREMSELWHKVLEQNVGLICFTKDVDGETQIAAVNCTGVTTPDGHFNFKPKTKVFSKILDTLEYIEARNNAFEKFGIDKYLSAMGVYVLPAFRGDGIGTEVLKAREPLCKALGIPASLSTFTSKYSQAVGEKAGFRNMESIPYADIAKATNNRLYHPNIEEHTKDIQVKFILYK